MKNLTAFALLSLSVLTPLSALAQAWPTKQPIKLVAVFPPGGSTDQVARILAQPLQLQLGQSVVVENKGGASGAIGTAQVAQAPADGYTFAVVFDTHAVNPSLIPNINFDTRKDLEPIALIGTAPMVLATQSTGVYKSFKEIVAAAKTGANNKALSYGTIGSGSLGHLAMEMIAKGNGLSWQHIPYRGGGPLMNDVVAGHVPLSIGSVFLSKPHIDSGRLRPLAVTTAKRSPDLPNVPTMAESGISGFDAPAWWAILAPAKTPPEILKRMNEEVNAALKNAAIAKKFDEQGIDVVGGSAETARIFINKQIDIWAKVVKDNNIKAD